MVSRIRSSKSDSKAGLAAEKSAMAKRLDEAIEESGGPSKISAISGVPLSTLTHYRTGRSAMSFSALVKLARATGVRTDWLASGEGDKQRPHDVSGSVAQEITRRVVGNEAGGGDADASFIAVPYFDSARAAAGGGAFIDNDSARYIAFDEPWLRRTFMVSPRDLALMPADGNSMEPTIRSGEVLLFDVSEEGRRLRDGIFIIRLEGAVLVKRLAPLPGHLIQVTTDNAAYKPYQVSIDAGTDFAILGRVVLVFRRL
jgi:phage repressor protein C with HTH and peptisase S24 domain